MAEKPQRMCAVCRSMKEKSELLRIVKNKDGDIFIDNTFKQNGRGLYLCKNKDCLAKAIKTKVINKAFKMQVPDAVYASLSEVTFE